MIPSGILFIGNRTYLIKAVAEKGEIVISANREGLLSLAKQLTALAEGVQGDHIHYDEYNSLEEGRIYICFNWSC